MSGPARRTPAGDSPEVLAEALRSTVGRFVRTVRSQSGSPRDAQADALADLAHAGSLSIAALAESRGVTHQSMRLVLARLEQEQLIERKPDPADGRSVLMTLTDAGWHAARQDRQLRSRWLAQAIETRLSAKEQADLGRALQLLLRLIDAE